MQRLMEQTPLPTLLMRTVIQSLSMYPRLIGFVLNILQRLIVKQVGILCFNFTEAGTVCCLLVDVVFLHYETIWFILHLFHLFEEFKSNFRKILLSKAIWWRSKMFSFFCFLVSSVLFLLMCFQNFSNVTWWKICLFFMRCGTRTRYGKGSSSAVSEPSHSRSKYFYNCQQHSLATCFKCHLIYVYLSWTMLDLLPQIRWAPTAVNGEKYMYFIWFIHLIIFPHFISCSSHFWSAQLYAANYHLERWV